jgi:hypothetical protein
MDHQRAAMNDDRTRRGICEDIAEQGAVEDTYVARRAGAKRTIQYDAAVAYERWSFLRVRDSTVAAGNAIEAQERGACWVSANGHQLELGNF